MSRPLTRNQALQNAAFLKLLRRDGNIRAAAREIGIAPSTLFNRRKQHAGFAQEWDVAVTMANIRLMKAGGRKGPKCATTHSQSNLGDMPSPNPVSGEDSPRLSSERAGRVRPDTRKREGDFSAPHRTTGGEPVVVRRRDGRLQVRRAQPGKLTRQCEQAFLLALSATANVSLAAAAAGAAEAAFYRRRKQNPAFAREMRMALQQGYERLETALLATVDPDSHADDAWRHNEPPEMPKMTVSQALQLMYLHQKEARLQAEPPHIKRRPGESSGAHSIRLSAMYEARMERDREAGRVAAAAARAAGKPWPFGPQPLVLPDLSQVTGWSNADPAKTPHHPTRALFGGWRLEDLSDEQKALRAKRLRERRGLSRE